MLSLFTNMGLDEYRLRITPHNKPVKRAFRCLECDHLLKFLAYLHTVIEANGHSELVAVSPVLDEKKVGDLERKTYIKRTATVPLCQIAHMPAQASTNPAAIINAVRAGNTPTTPRRKAIRFEDIERIETLNV
jgi:hypothetical protein